MGKNENARKYEKKQEYGCPVHIPFWPDPEQKSIDEAGCHNGGVSAHLHADAVDQRTKEHLRTARLPANAARGASNPPHVV